MPATFITDRTALVIEANSKLFRPYEYLAPIYEEHRTASFVEAKSFLECIVPDLILISASFAPEQIIEFLSEVKKQSSKYIIPIIFVVDLSHRLNFIPGIFWDEMLAVLDSSVSQDVFVLTMSRVMKPRSL